MAVNGGISAGSAAVGALSGHLPLGWCFAVPGAVTVAAAGLAGGGCPRARRGAGNCATSQNGPADEH
jgi:hypothetical protein